MKKLLLILGLTALVCVLSVGGSIVYGMRQGKALEASSKAYVDASLPPIISNWSEEELIKRSSPALLKIINARPGQLSELFQTFAKLGPMQSYDASAGDTKVNTSYTTKDGKVTSASYVVTAKFANGDATITLRLIQVAGEWQINLFNVKSPLFLQ